MGHASAVSELVSGEDGKTIFSAGWDGELREWVVADGGKRTEFVTGLAPLSALTIQPGFETAAVAGRGGKIGLISIPSLQSMLQFDGAVGDTGEMAFCPTMPHVLAMAGSEGVALWDTKSGPTHIWKRTDVGFVGAVSWHHDGEKLAVGGLKGGVVELSAADGSSLAEFKTPEDWIEYVGYVRGADVLITAGGSGMLRNGRFIVEEPPAIRIWSGDPRKEIRRLDGSSEPTTDIVESRDGTLLVSGGWDGELRIWDRSTGEELATFNVGRSRILAVAAAPDLSWIAAGTQSGDIHVWALPDHVAQRTNPNRMSTETAPQR